MKLEEELKLCIVNAMTVVLKAHLFSELAKENTSKLLITVISTEDVWVGRHWLRLHLDISTLMQGDRIHRLHRIIYRHEAKILNIEKSPFLWFEQMAYVDLACRRL